MKGRAFVDRLRKEWPSSDILSREARTLLADAVEEADGSFRDLIESECLRVGDRVIWWDTSRLMDGLGGDYKIEVMPSITRALSYLDRRGLIERKAGEPHMVRFREGA